MTYIYCTVNGTYVAVLCVSDLLSVNVQLVKGCLSLSEYVNQGGRNDSRYT